MKRFLLYWAWSVAALSALLMFGVALFGLIEFVQTEPLNLPTWVPWTILGITIAGAIMALVGALLEELYG